MTNISTSDTFGTTLNMDIIFGGECVRYTSADLPGILVDIWAHEDGNLNMVEADLTVCGTIGVDAHSETFLLNLHTSPDAIHGIFSGLLS